MNIKLKKLKIIESMSEETTCFTADVVINGYTAGYAKNDGQGGCTGYHAYDEKGKQLINEAEAFCKTLPDKTIEIGEGRSFTFNVTLESTIDDIVDEAYKEKATKAFITKRNKAMLKSIVFTTKEKLDESYSITNWKNFDIATMLSMPLGKETIRKKLLELKANNYIILNTNIPTEIMPN